MFNDWVFLPMRASNDLLGDPDALRERMRQDSYLYFRGVLDRDRVLALRKKMLLALAEQGWVQRTPFLMQALSITPPKRESDEDFLVGYDAVQRIEEFHTLAHDPALVDIMRQVRG